MFSFSKTLDWTAFLKILNFDESSWMTSCGKFLSLGEISWMTSCFSFVQKQKKMRRKMWLLLVKVLSKWVHGSDNAPQTCYFKGTSSCKIVQHCGKMYCRKVIVEILFKFDFRKSLDRVLFLTIWHFKSSHETFCETQIVNCSL